MTMANAKFTMRYDETFTEQVTVNNSPAGTYDAAYVLAYAAAALGDEPITGSSLSRAIARLLPPGDPVDVGPTRILDALDLLHAGKNIDLRGANGTLDFDLSNGEPAADSIIQCAAVDAAGKVTGGIDSGLAYDAASHSLLGQMRCP
jgi:branched-chain amino acid transport system substrate-binding protein